MHTHKDKMLGEFLFYSFAIYGCYYIIDVWGQWGLI